MQNTVAVCPSAIVGGPTGGVGSAGAYSIPGAVYAHYPVMLGNARAATGLSARASNHRHCHQRRRSLACLISFNSHLSRVTKSSVACRRRCSSSMSA